MSTDYLVKQKSPVRTVQNNTVMGKTTNFMLVTFHKIIWQFSQIQVEQFYNNVIGNLLQMQSTRNVSISYY